MPTRFTSAGFAGGKGSAGVSDPYIQTLVVPMAHQATASAIDTGIFLPEGGVYTLSGYINVLVAEATAAIKTVAVGEDGAPAAFASAIDVSSTGLKGTFTVGPVIGGTEINYTFAGADFAEFEGEAVINIQVATVA